MKRRCKTCKKSFSAPDRGRRPKFCSAACRQKAYRKREADPHGKLKALWASDLYKIKDITARARGAVKVLEELGYEVILNRRTTPRPQKKPSLTVVSDDETIP